MIAALPLKLVLFYTSSLLAIIILFTLVTSYGEENLRVSAKINGNYKVSPLNLPGCLNQKPLELIIQQSGIFVNASLIAKDISDKPRVSAEERYSLFGKWQNQNLSLSGNITQIQTCANSERISIQAQISGKNLTGKITGNNGTSEIVAERESKESVEPKINNH